MFASELKVFFVSLGLVLKACFFFVFVCEVKAQGLFIRPNLSNPNLIPLRAGAMLNPLCAAGGGASCFQEWLSYAQPLTHVSVNGRLNQELYLPVLHQMVEAQGLSEMYFQNQGYKLMPGFHAQSSRRLYKKDSYDDLVEVRGSGENTRIRTGKLVYVPEKDLKLSAGDSEQPVFEDLREILEAAASSEEERKEEPPPEDENKKLDSTSPAKEERKDSALSPENEDQENAQGQETTTATPTPSEETKPQEAGTGEVSGEKEASAGEANTQNTDEQDGAEDSFNLSVRRPTFAVRTRAAQTKELAPGCVTINKPHSPAATSQATCLHCSGDLRSHTKDIENFLTTVHTTHSKKLKYLKKICTPHESLKGLIRNFERSCKGKFKDFVSDLYCISCQRGVPPEVMLAMMSIESSGRCGSVNDSSHETSLGLFQVNADVHSCKGHQKKSSANRECLMNITNNTLYGVRILRDAYKLTNGSLPETRPQNCTGGWTGMGKTKRDQWRKAVSAYNGGQLYVIRAQNAVKRALINNPNPPTWEQLRVYSFATKLSAMARGEKRKGRAIRNTISNLAHTEAVLGREIQGSPPGVVEFWEQYLKKQELPSTCES